MDLYDFSKWVKIALVNGMPDSLLLSTMINCLKFWLQHVYRFLFGFECLFQRDRYQEMFERVNYLIDNVQPENEKEMDTMSFCYY